MSWNTRASRRESFVSRAGSIGIYEDSPSVFSLEHLDQDAPSSFSRKDLYVSDWNDAEAEMPQLDHCGQRFAITEQNRARVAWELMMAIFLVYTGTVFLYRLCFITNNATNPQYHDFGWDIINEVVSLAFMLDLVLNFFFTYRDSYGLQIDSLRLIAANYLSGIFWINLIACIPEAFWQLLFEGVFLTADTNNSNKGLQALKIQRVTRLTRLLRISRLAKLASLSKSNSFIRRIRKNPGVQSSSFLFLLFFIVHVVACGWYLCGSMAEEVERTWLVRRVLYTDSEKNDITVLDVDHFEQYVHSFYFVLTVFTTVGFGDMSAYTQTEMLYSCFVMIVGAISHGMVINEVISRMRDGNQLSQNILQMTCMIEAFAQQTSLSEDLEDRLKDWVAYNSQDWHEDRYDKVLMKSAIKGKFFPRELVGQLPDNLYKGRVTSNNFVSWMTVNTSASASAPTSLPILLALSLSHRASTCGEIVYQFRDSAFNLMLVCSGTFASVGFHGSDGGSDAVNPGNSVMVKSQSQAAKSGGTSNGVSSPEDVLRSGLAPYQLFSYNSYFGDVELILGGLRRATVRCESTSGGELLILNAGEFAELIEQFPECHVYWIRMAAWHEWTRRRRLARLVQAKSYRNFAARCIQRHFRMKRGHVRTDSRALGKRGSLAADVYSVLGAHLKKKEHERDVSQRLNAVERSVQGLQTQMELGFRAILEQLGDRGQSSRRLDLMNPVQSSHNNGSTASMTL